MPHLRKRGDTWHALFYEFDPATGSHRRVERSTHCTDRRAAETVAAQYERDAADPAGAAASRATLSDALKLLTDDRTAQAAAGKKAQATVEFYEKKAGQLTRLFEGADDEHYRPFLLSQLTSAAVDDYIAQRRKEGAGENTISKELITLRSALKLAKRRGLWRGDVAEVLPVAFAPEYRPRERFLTVQEYRELVEQLTDDRAARVAFIVATSAEWGATERAERGDIDLDAHQVHVRGTKRKTRDRVVPLAFPVQRELLAFALANAKGDLDEEGKPVEGRPLFLPWGSVRRDLHAACDRATRKRRENDAEAPAVEHCSPNDLRRTFSHWISAEGVPNELLAPMMGHADTRMLDKVYNRKTPAELAAALQRLLEAQGGPAKKKPKKAKSAPKKRQAGEQRPQPATAAKGCHTGATAEAVPRRCHTLRAEVAAPGGSGGAPQRKSPRKSGASSVPRDGIEPSTRGFSVLGLSRLTTRKDDRKRVRKERFATPVPQQQRPLRVVGARQR